MTGSRDREPVTGGVYGIPERMKEISESLFIMFNRRTQKFEVHDSEQGVYTLCCDLSFDELDARAIEYVRERHVSRLQTLAEEIDRHNEKLEEKAHSDYLNRANDRMFEAVKYLKAHESADELPEEMLNEE